jgi:hypothetical protein
MSFARSLAESLCMHLGVRRVSAAAFAVGSCFLACPVLADDTFSIAGTYVQNAACKGDGSDPAAKLVRITETDVHSSFGVCTFVKKEHQGNTLAAQMSCNGPGGNILLGDVRFTVRDDKNIDFVDQDNTYTSVLYKCPRADAARQAPVATSTR